MVNAIDYLVRLIKGVLQATLCMNPITMMKQISFLDSTNDKIHSDGNRKPNQSQLLIKLNQHLKN